MSRTIETVGGSATRSPFALKFGSRPVLVAHHRKHHLYNTACAYQEVGRLAGFATQRWAFHPKWCALVARIRLPGPGREAVRCINHFDDRLTGRVFLHCPTRTSYASHLLLGSVGSRFVQQPFQQWVGDLVRAEGWHCHTHCTGAFEIFKVCKSEGLLCLLEQYIGDRRQGAKLLIEESELQGIVDFNGVLENSGLTPDKIEINEAEYALADAVVAGSPFVVDTLLRAGVPAQKVVLAPYGVSSEWVRPPGAPVHRKDGEPLQIAFVGNDLVRKGLVYALKAVAKLGARTAHLHVFGCGDNFQFRQLFGPHATFHGSLGPPALRAALLRCHAGVLPSLWEGSPYAVFEMFACGLPVVVTPNTGAVVTDGLDGFVVPIRSTEAIVESLRKLLDDSLRQDMSKNACETALRSTWGAYGRNLLEGLGLRRGDSPLVAPEPPDRFALR